MNIRIMYVLYNIVSDQEFMRKNGVPKVLYYRISIDLKFRLNSIQYSTQ